MQTQDEGEGTSCGAVGIVRVGDVGNQAPSNSRRGGLVDDDEDAMDIDAELCIQQDMDNEHAMDIINTKLRMQKAITKELRTGCADKNEACEVDDEADSGSQHESVPGGEAESSDGEASSSTTGRGGGRGRVDDEASASHEDTCLLQHIKDTQVDDGGCDFHCGGSYTTTTKKDSGSVMANKKQKWIADSDNEEDNGKVRVRAKKQKCIADSDDKEDEEDDSDDEDDKVDKEDKNSSCCRGGDGPGNKRKRAIESSSSGSPSPAPPPKAAPKRRPKCKYIDDAASASDDDDDDDDDGAGSHDSFIVRSDDEAPGSVGPRPQGLFPDESCEEGGNGVNNDNKDSNRGDGRGDNDNNVGSGEGGGGDGLSNNVGSGEGGAGDGLGNNVGSGGEGGGGSGGGGHGDEGGNNELALEAIRELALMGPPDSVEDADSITQLTAECAGRGCSDACFQDLVQLEP